MSSVPRRRSDSPACVPGEPLCLPGHWNCKRARGGREERSCCRLPARPGRALAQVLGMTSLVSTAAPSLSPFKGVTSQSDLLGPLQPASGAWSSGSACGSHAPSQKCLPRERAGLQAPGRPPLQAQGLGRGLEGQGLLRPRVRGPTNRDEATPAGWRAPAGRPRGSARSVGWRLTDVSPGETGQAGGAAGAGPPPRAWRLPGRQRGKEMLRQRDGRSSKAAPSWT